MFKMFNMYHGSMVFLSTLDSPVLSKHQFHCATVLFVGVIFTLLLTKKYEYDVV